MSKHPMTRHLGLPLAITTAMGFLSPQTALVAAELNVLQSTVVDPSALNFTSAAATFSQNVNGRTYQRSPMSTFKGYQYATYYDGNRNVCLARRKLPAGLWDSIRFTDYTINSSDSHNVVALGICAADGTIHLAFDHHADPLNYRVSVAGAASNPDSVTWSTSLFGPVTDKLGSLSRLTSVTYPSFFNAPNGNLMLYFRYQGSGSGDGMIQEYNGTTHDWTSGMGKFIARTGTYNGALSTNSTTRNPYINGISYGGNRLHASWGWRENSGGAQFNHDLNYAYSDDNGRTWNNSAGSQIGTTNSSFITINSSGLLVAPIPQGIGLSNQYTHYAYPDGSCHVIVQHHQSGTTSSAYHHYWRNAAGTWSSEVLPFSGSRPKLVGDENRELYLAYTSGGILRVAKGSPNAAITSWNWSTIHSQTGRSEGGEGQIDTTRWEAERVLSVYGQVSPSGNGAPTELNVFDYQVSPKAILPQPARESSDIPTSSSMQWTAGISASSHRLYLGTDPAAVASATTASPEYIGAQASTTHTPSAPLAHSTTYYWRVDEVDTQGTVHAGLLWSFTTAENLPPTLSEIPDLTLPVGSPVPDIPITVSGDIPSPETLVVTAMSSNSDLLPDENINIAGSGTDRIIRITPVAGELGTTLITIRVDDGSHLAEESFSLTIIGPVYPLFSDAHDASVKETPAVVDETLPTTLLGTGGNDPWVDRCTVYVFQLPDLGPVPDPFTTASFTFEFPAKQNTLNNNDLYGLARRAAPFVLASDYYGLTSTPDPSATLLQADILNNGTPIGLITTSAEGGDSLRDYLNAQYASGAGAGEFVFLRLNNAGPKDGIDRATLTMSEGGSPAPLDTRPRISITSTAFSAQHAWRAQYFETPVNSGDGADDADPNNDGELNMLEFATGQDPKTTSLVSTPLARDGTDLEFTYPCSVAALDDGIIFTVEYSDSLLAGSWVNHGVTEIIDSEDDHLQSIIATIPAENTDARFARLKVTQP